ncbi:hypothetical protein EMPS_07402 [Entomortierella parvispora]|uniref:F-box domain-containing protein n=1 Tax=Entomortierella parvispora TaxID=205924 RepID=A0A9P3HE83_9FUNG|nr:hypothetical protein EMPS_07402 [Entomortierella parvispora]
MLRFVKEGALDLLAFTLPSSLLESIRQVSEDDFLATQLSHRQRQPRLRNSSSSSHRSVATARRGPRAQSNNLLCGSHSASRPHDLPTEPLVPSVQLPYEVLTLVFQFLPASDLFSILAVCRLWRQIALQETKHVDLSEGFPMDCLGLEENEYSDFDFVYNLFSIFPLISSLVIKDRYMRDRDLRVVTAGILAGKMAFTRPYGPAVGSPQYIAIRKAIEEQKQLQLGQQPQQQDPQQQQHIPDQNQERNQENATTTKVPLKATITKVMRGSIKEQLRDFSKSIGTYVLIPQTRKTLRKKILERLEQNLEQKEVQEYLWVQENDIDPNLLPTTEATYSTLPSTSISGLDTKRYPLVPMTHYRFQDCCFANDWGAVMDLNKLPMIGLAAAISGQGLVVDLEGSYGAPSRSIKSMLGFCFGAHCVISLELNFRHTHMELEHVVELLSENPILYKVDIVDSAAYQDLIRLPALRGLGGIMEKMQDACLDLDEGALESLLMQARVVLQGLEKQILQEEEDRERAGALSKGSEGEDSITTEDPMEDDIPTSHPAVRVRRIRDDVRKPTESLTHQLPFSRTTPTADKFRTAKVLLKGVVDNGVIGLINTRDRQSGQSLLHALAWRRSYMSLVAQSRHAALPTPPSSLQDKGTSGILSSSFPPKGYFSNRGPSGFFSTSPPQDPPMFSAINDQGASHVSLPPSEDSQPASQAPDSIMSDQPAISKLSSLRSISALPAALTSALSFRRLSLPASSIWIPQDSEDIGVGGGSLPTPEADDNDDGDADNELEHEATTLNTVNSNGPLAVEKEMSPLSNPAEKEEPLFIPEHHPVGIALRMAQSLLDLKADPNIYNRDGGRSPVVCASFMGFQPMETLLIAHGGYSKELIRIRESMN